MFMSSENGNAEAALMFEILDFARRHERRIYEDQTKLFGEEAEPAIQRLTQREYLRNIRKEHPFYVITSKGLNLFEDKRKSDVIPEELKNRILEKLGDTISELETKPWELKLYIIHIIGNSPPITPEEIMQCLQQECSDARGISKPSVYRNLKYLRMKGYIEYEKMLYKGQNLYQLSEKGKETFKMTKADAARKLRTSEEWDTAIKGIFQGIDEEKKQDDEALFYTLSTIFPDLDNLQLIWILYAKGNIQELKGNLDKAEREYLRMEEICEEITDKKGRAYALKGLGNVAFKLRRYSAAEQYYKRCQKIAQSLGDNLLLSDILNNVGSCSYMNDEVDGALHYYEKALEVVGDDALRHASILYNEGLCYVRKEDLVRAKELWLKSLDLYEELQEKTEIKKVRHNLREIDRKLKREYLEDKYRKTRQNGMTEDIKNAYRELVTFLMEDFTKGG